MRIYIGDLLKETDKAYLIHGFVIKDGEAIIIKQWVAKSISEYYESEKPENENDWKYEYVHDYLEVPDWISLITEEEFDDYVYKHNRKRINELSKLDLEEMLEKAIKDEDYLVAAQIRDKLKLKK